MELLLGVFLSFLQISHHLIQHLFVGSAFGCKRRLYRLCRFSERCPLTLREGHDLIIRVGSDNAAEAVSIQLLRLFQDNLVGMFRRCTDQFLVSLAQPIKKFFIGVMVSLI